MSGHSKWSTIKRKKGAIDSERSKVFQKLAKELYVAAKSGDPNPDNNSSLRMVVEKAKAENMPKANIESAINKAKNKSSDENFESVRTSSLENLFSVLSTDRSSAFVVKKYLDENKDKAENIFVFSWLCSF